MNSNRFLTCAPSWPWTSSSPYSNHALSTEAWNDRCSNLRDTKYNNCTDLYILLWETHSTCLRLPTFRYKSPVLVASSRCRRTRRRCRLAPMGPAVGVGSPTSCEGRSRWTRWCGVAFMRISTRQMGMKHNTHDGIQQTIKIISSNTFYSFERINTKFTRRCLSVEYSRD